MGDPNSAPAYWGGFDWRAIIAFISIIGGIISPFLAAWWKGRADLSTSKAKEAEFQQDRLDRIGREQFAMAEHQRDEALRRCRVMEQERTALEADRDMGWDLARAMEAFAHEARHAHVSTVFNFNTLLGFFCRLASGTLTSEQAQRIADQQKPEVPPPLVPLLRALAPMKPPETKL